MKKIILLMAISFLAGVSFIYLSGLHKSNVESADSGKSEPKISKASERVLNMRETIYSVSLKDDNNLFGEIRTKLDFVRFGFNPDGTLQILDRHERHSWPINYITFTDSINGFAVGGFGTVLKTEDGGKTWNQMPQVSEYDLTQAVFVNQSTGYVAGKFGVRNKKTGDDEWEVGIWKSDDGGSSWNLSYHVKNKRYIFDMSVVSSEIALASVDEERLIRTADGGKTWNEISTNNKIVTSVTFGPDGTGWLVGSDGNFLKSTDKGESWKEVNNLSKELLNHKWWSIVIGKTGNGLAVSEEGFVLYTTDSGTKWQQHTKKIGDALRKVDVYEKTGVILGSKSLYSVDFSES